MNELFEALELIDWLISGWAGWRYLLSRSYRQKIHQRWRQQSRLAVATEMFWGILAFLFTLCLAAVFTLCLAAGVAYLIAELII